MRCGTDGIIEWKRAIALGFVWALNFGHRIGMARAPRFFSDISYSLYLVQGPILLLLTGLKPMIGFGNAAAVTTWRRSEWPASSIGSWNGLPSYRTAAVESLQECSGGRSCMFRILVYILAGAVCAVIAGCGGSTPLPSHSAASPESGSATQAASAPVYTETSAAFAQISPAEWAKAVQIASCNVDQINGQPANGVPLDHMGSGKFSGWAADATTKTVPPDLRVILVGSRNFAVPAKTGVLRPDVANGTGVKAFITSGFRVNADMDAVPVGKYALATLYKSGGKLLLCHTNVTLWVQ